MIEVVPEAAEVLSSIVSQSIHRVNNALFNTRLAQVYVFLQALMIEGALQWRRIFG